MKLPALKELVEERKDKAIESLSTSFAKNRLPLEEYERLVEYINKIESERELIVVEKMVAEYGRSGEPAEDNGGGQEYPVENPDDSAGETARYYHSPSISNLSLLSSRIINGPVKSGAQYVSLLGNTDIRIRKADLAKRRTVLNVVSILGENVIRVEPGIRVFNNAVPLLGGAWTDEKVNRQARDDGPELVISGTAILGNVTVKLLKE